jgi:hypothetical protein
MKTPTIKVLIQILRANNYIFQMDIAMVFLKLYCMSLVALFGKISALIIAIAFVD